MKKYLLLMAVAGLFLTSCKKCKDCQINYETLNGYNMSDLNDAGVIMGYSNWDSYMQSLYPSEELCSDALEAAEDISESTDLDSDGTLDYRVYWDCK